MKNKWEDVCEIGPQCHERFLHHERVPELVKLDIGMAGVSRLEGHYKIGYKALDAHTVIYTTTGGGLLHVEEGSIKIESSSLMLIPANHPHLFELNCDYWETTWFCIDATNRWASLSKEVSSVECCDKAQVIRYLMYQLYYESDKTLREVPLKQLEFYLSSTLMVAGQKCNQNNRLDALFRDVESQLHYPWTIEEMSGRVHYSAPHLHRLCQHAYGRSPIQQLIYLRMECAKNLLADTDWSISQIASKVGYQDVFNFSNRFKKSAGNSPSQFRKKNN